MVRREKKPASKAAPRGGARSVVSNYGVLAASVKTLSCGTKPESTVTPDGKRAKSSASHQPEANPYGYRLLVMEMGQLSWVDVANNQDLAVCQTEDVKHRQASQTLWNNAGENWFHAQPDKQDCEQGGRDATECHDGISTQRRCRDGQQRLKAEMMVGYC